MPAPNPSSIFAPSWLFAPSWFEIAFSCVGIVVALGFVFVIVTVIRNARRTKKAGYDPMTLQTELAVRAMNSRTLAPERSLPDRLAELEQLKDTGTISAAEYSSARADILRR